MKKVKETLNDQASIASELNSLSEQATAVGNALNFRLGEKQLIKEKVKNVAERIKKESSTLTDFKDKLSQIVVLYEETETSILGNAALKENGETEKKVSQSYDHTTATFDDNKKNGTYGADQGDMSHNKKEIDFF